MTQYVIDNFRGVNKVILKKEIEQYQQHDEEYLKKNEKLIEELKKQENKEYFVSLDNNKKQKLISLQSDYKYEDEESEESTIDDEINKILNRYNNFQKKAIHKHLNEFIREHLKKWTKKNKKGDEENEK